MRAVLLITSAIISLAIMYSLGWLSLWLIVSKDYQFLDFTLAYFVAGFFASLVLGSIVTFCVMMRCAFGDWNEEDKK